MAIKLYWHRGSGRNDPQKRNFGDYLSPLIVEAVSGQAVSYAPLKSADLMAIGTILANEHKAKRFGLSRRIHIWGSGCGQPDERFNGRHYYHAVRGRETLRRIAGQPDVRALGDPGLLAEMLVRRPSQKRFKLGFVPHYVDQGCPDAIAFAAMDGVQLINVFDEPLSVLAHIAACDFVVSSSLHGLVIADAYGVPNARIRFSEGLIDELKFVDYYSAFNIEPPPVLCAADLPGIVVDPGFIAATYARDALPEIQASLIKSFPSI